MLKCIMVLTPGAPPHAFGILNCTQMNIGYLNIYEEYTAGEVEIEKLLNLNQPIGGDRQPLMIQTKVTY